MHQRINVLIRTSPYTTHIHILGNSLQYLKNNFKNRPQPIPFSLGKGRLKDKKPSESGGKVGQGRRNSKPPLEAQVFPAPEPHSIQRPQNTDSGLTSLLSYTYPGCGHTHPPCTHTQSPTPSHPACDLAFQGSNPGCMLGYVTFSTVLFPLKSISEMGIITPDYFTWEGGGRQ